ncbi:MAG: DUF2480 family protein [Crocinitomicaceae bacterium]
MSEIRNRVKESGLISMDLATFVPTVNAVEIDLKDQLWQGLALKEKDFRSWIKTHDWEQYSGKAVNVTCSADAIIPTWAFMLVSSKLLEANAFSVIGDQTELQNALIKQKINELDLKEFEDGRIIIKGCADVKDPAYAMSELLKKLQPVAKSIMYGEPCSTVPLFKR